ncbi:hypothetical protein CEXT_240471 [Caerostris extrusa]|uniref:Uncharacterized protein n=1 Tax=Caerostris extrusa TaxID=172846 RepID=A0AAV4WF81_CAEEX|nr:hypothetical protein CEXT_240471 [Caerostris extrusa]
MFIDGLTCKVPAPKSYRTRVVIAYDGVTFTHLVETSRDASESCCGLNAEVRILDAMEVVGGSKRFKGKMLGGKINEAMVEVG